MEAPEPPQPRPALPPSLQELRSRVSETAFCDASDAQLVKFLYARKGDVDRAAELVQSHCEWKMMKWQMAPLDLPTAAEVLPLAQTGLFCVPGCRDKEGHLIIFVRPRFLDLGRFEVLDVVRYLWYLLDKAMDDPVTGESGFCIVNNAMDLSLTQTSPLLPKEILGGLVGALPARLRAAFVLNQPWGMQTMFSTIAGNILPTKLYQKIHICGSDYQPLQAHVAADQIPSELGGSYEVSLDAFLEDPAWFPPSSDPRP